MNEKFTYIFQNPTEYISNSVISKRLNTDFIGHNIIVLDSVDSTNNYLKSLARNGAKQGTVVIAREQTCGKGRLGRIWSSEKDKNLTFSLLLRPDISPMAVSGITPLAGLAVCKAMRELLHLDCKIKWPNDVIAGNKKLAGILTEMSAEKNSVEFIIIGIGINLNQEIFPEEIKHKASSLYLETGKKINKNLFLAELLTALEKEFLKSNYKLNSQNISEYKTLCATVGRQVSFCKNGATITGTATDITQSGELTVELPDKTTSIVNSGEVTIQGIY